MAETHIIECPATPERIDQCPETPDRFQCVKSPESSSAASSCDDNDFCFLGRSRTGSPPPNCAICLGKCKSKCFTDSCLHQFCFKCLLEWSKIKAECPLCKQPFKSIIHNVKSIDQFEEYYVPPPQPQSIPVPRPIPSHSTLFNPRFVHEMASRTATLLNTHQYSHLQRFDVFLSEMPRFVTGYTLSNVNSRHIGRSAFLNGFSATVQVHPTTEAETIHHLLANPNRSLTSTLRQQLRMICYIPGGNMGQMWRKFVYEKKLYALPVVDITGRFRECSARFYRDNPAQMHRLLPWLNRDLVCLLQNSQEHQVGFVLSTLTELLTIYNITSPEFRRRCQPYLRRRTSHFIHEFVNFSRSPYDMIGYDREVRYAPYVEPQTETSGIADDTEESRILRASLAGFTFSSRSEFTRFMLSSNMFEEDFGFGAYNPDINFSDLPAIDLIESNDESNLGDVPQSRRLVHNEIENVVVSSSSSDECEFVREEKPPHLRTPDMVSLHSESDSDVVFVSECVTKKESDSPEPRKLRKTQKRKLQQIMSTIFSLSSSGSSSSSSSSSNESDLEKEFKVRKKLKAEDPEKIPKKEKCEDPNKGASTSSGVTNATTKRTLRKKYYARPVRQARSKHKKNVKSIYEESSDSYSNCTSSEATDISTDTESDSTDTESDSDTSSDRTTSKKRRKSNRKTKKSKHRRSDSSIKKKKSKKFRRKTQRKKVKKTKRQRTKRCIYSSSSPSPSPSPATKSPETVPDDV